MRDLRINSRSNMSYTRNRIKWALKISKNIGSHVAISLLVSTLCVMRLISLSSE